MTRYSFGSIPCTLGRSGSGSESAVGLDADRYSEGEPARLDCGLHVVVDHAMMSLSLRYRVSQSYAWIGLAMAHVMWRSAAGAVNVTVPLDGVRRAEIEQDDHATEPVMRTGVNMHPQNVSIQSTCGCKTRRKERMGGASLRLDKTTRRWCALAERRARRSLLRARPSLSFSNKRVLQELGRGRPALVLDLEGLVEKVVRFCRDVIRNSRTAR